MTSSSLPFSVQLLVRSREANENTLKAVRRSSFCPLGRQELQRSAGEDCIWPLHGNSSLAHTLLNLQDPEHVCFLLKTVESSLAFSLRFAAQAAGITRPLLFVWLCVLCLIVVPLAPGKAPFAVQLSNTRNIGKEI
jgi:hypothetical protein